MSEPKQSFSQSGEDLIIDFIFDTLKIGSRRYLDIGANDPMHISNTYRFYLRGEHGVCIEPDPTLAKDFRKVRPEDKVLAVGIGTDSQKKLPFYIMDPPTLNTFSKKEADLYQKYYPWTSVVKTIKVKLVNINEIIKKHFKNGLDILSIDTEGMDLEIIKSIDFSLCSPLVICVETAVYTGEKSLKKNDELIEYIRSKGYFVYADTFVNTIFVNYDGWLKNNGSTLEGF